MPYIQCNGADLYYEDHGEGPPIVFLHGVMCVSSGKTVVRPR